MKESEVVIMTKTDKLKNAYKDMKNGKIIEFLSDNGGYNCKCWVANSNNSADKRKYIFWRGYGQSANRMSLNELRWIAKMIAKCTTYDYRIVSNTW